jgi:hypothetical protein
MNLPQASADAVQMLGYMTNFIAGLYTNGENGYAPANGSAYWLYLGDVVTKNSFSTWSQFSAGNIADHNLTGALGLDTADPGIVGHSPTGALSGYPVIAKAALADLITYTQSPQAIEAYGYVAGQIAAAWAGDSIGMAAAYQTNPMWSVMPRLPDGEYLQASQRQIDISNNSTVMLTATGGDSLLSVVGGGTATLVGGNGGTDLLFGGSGPTTLVAGTGNDYLFAGAGATTFIDNKGDDYMKGGPAADIFTFADVNPGRDTVANFKVGTDTLKIGSNLNGNGITSAAQLISGASAVGGSTVLHLDPHHDVTILGIGTPSALANSIIVF